MAARESLEVAILAGHGDLDGREASAVGAGRPATALAAATVPRPAATSARALPATAALPAPAPRLAAARLPATAARLLVSHP
jgi:hypothetical protein